MDAADLAIVRANLRHALPLFTAPAAAAAAPAPVFAGTPATARTARPPRRGVLDVAEAGLPA